MPAFPPANIAESDRSLFSPRQMEWLMRGEFFRAQRYGHPLAAMVIGVDRLGSLQDLYGFDSKREILHGVVDLLRRVTRASDYLGVLVDDRLLAVFPHTERTGAGALAWRLLKGARDVQFDSDGRIIQITLSIGSSERGFEHIHDFDDLVGAAEAGMLTAMESGGDRYIVREELVAELGRLQGELDELRNNGPALAPAPETPVAGPPVAEPPAAMPVFPILPALPVVPPGAPGLDPGAIEEGPEEILVTRIQALFASLGAQNSPGLQQVEEHLIALALSGLREQRDHLATSPSDDYLIQIKNLERRVAKLSKLLGMTEEELKRVMKLKNVDPGMASIYREVQGLASDTSHLELKRELMRKIFEANVTLQKEIGNHK